MKFRPILLFFTTAHKDDMDLDARVTTGRALTCQVSEDEV